ncbi:ECF RNA polymerase sigma factor SigG [Rhodococcus sp. RD6.2]|uniref:sigma-70 family RNA polymerase sigma factor n=1 Tax=Rhodococcus sp. RD6.2 TaxID=260936 RepID=UPI00063B8F60|nr:sigma-70 family RNA polymerase sigma factor [Rhodococcus sp. RD6.2]CRK54374.1 ECF RNA polymerase sigma factor SigG [Rhodococcus sp. RD6.2]
MTESAVRDEFTPQAEQYRRELLAHCYRMSGSVHEAEDLVQETYLKAWRAYDKFEGRSSLRTWLYRIATTTCLTALENRGRRPLPTGLGAPSSDPADDLVTREEVPWLEPIPDEMLGVDASDPATVATSRESLRLALIAALQFLPPKQRAVLILREVLAWPAADVAAMLDTSTAAVNSALQRARAQLAEAAPREDAVLEPVDPEQRALLERFQSAFENYDMAALTELFTRDAVWEMPPFEGWYQGPDAIRTLIETNCPAKAAGDMRLLPTVSNGQPAFGLYMRGEDGVHRAFQLQVVSLGPSGIGHVTVFFDLSLFAKFSLPEVFPS